MPDNASNDGIGEAIHVALARVYGTVRITLPRLVKGELEMSTGEIAGNQDENGKASDVVSDVLIVDAELPDWSSEATAQQAGQGKDVAAHVIAVPPDVDEATVATTVEAGIAAYLSTREDAATITEAVRSLSGGEREPFSRRVADALLRQRTGDTAGLNALTGRERDVLRLMARGYSNDTIADDVHLSLSTVKKHIDSIYGKLDIRRRQSNPKITHPRVMAAVITERHGLV